MGCHRKLYLPNPTEPFRRCEVYTTHMRRWGEDEAVGELGQKERFFYFFPLCIFKYLLNMVRRGRSGWKIGTRRVPALPWRLLSILLLLFGVVVHQTTRWSQTSLPLNNNKMKILQQKVASTSARSGIWEKRFHARRAWTLLWSLCSLTCVLSRLGRRALQGCLGETNKQTGNCWIAQTTHRIWRCSFCVCVYVMVEIYLRWHCSRSLQTAGG